MYLNRDNSGVSFKMVMLIVTVVSLIALPFTMFMVVDKLIAFNNLLQLYFEYGAALYANVGSRFLSLFGEHVFPWLVLLVVNYVIFNRSSVIYSNIGEN